jgi:tol-pal system protein YbgF
MQRNPLRRTAGYRILFALMVSGCVAGAAGGAYAQGAGDISDLRQRLDRLDRSVQDLQREIFRNGGQAASPDADESQPLTEAPSLQRMNDLETSLRAVTGQIEEFGNKLDALSRRLDRVEKEQEYQRNAAATPLTGEGTEEAPPAPATSPSTGLALASGILGTLPAGSTTTPRAPAASTANTNSGDEYQRAMSLLTQAKYDQAQTAFRSFATNHPKDAQAGDALYWAGDISYSAKKDYTEAARSFAELLKSYPQASRAPEGMLKLGLSLVALGQKDQGCVTLAALAQKYPKASTAVLSRAKTERSKAGCS